MPRSVHPQCQGDPEGRAGSWAVVSHPCRGQNSRRFCCSVSLVGKIPCLVVAAQNFSSLAGCSGGVVAAHVHPSEPPDPPAAWVGGRRRAVSPSAFAVALPEEPGQPVCPSAATSVRLSEPGAAFPSGWERFPLGPPRPPACGGAAGPPLCWSPSPSLAAPGLALGACLKAKQGSVYSGGKSLLNPGFSKKAFFNILGFLGRSPLITL